MDTTFEWPLKPVTTRVQIAPLTNPIAIVVPIVVGSHSMVVRMSAQWPDAAGRIDMFLGKSKTLTGEEILLYHCSNNGGIVGGETTPVINAAGYDGRGMMNGIKSVYVPEGEQLAVTYTSLNVPFATLHYSVITVPSNQPLAPLFN
jgi:hypothetical protein